jgi:uncharacterized protein
MNISKYTFFIEHDTGKYIYNSLSNALMKIDDEKLFFKIQDFNSKEFDINDLNEDDETIKHLMQACVIIEKQGDELLQYKSLIWNRRKLENVYNITIAPTLDCNFKCYYCFESHLQGIISEDVIKRIVKYINTKENLKHINLTWFGGEPLMAFEQIKRIAQSLKLPALASMSSLLITNGYYLNKNTVDELYDAKITDIQLSIDGIFDDYNSVKKMREDKNCFLHLLENLDYFATQHQKINLLIRVNLHRNNQDTYIKICDFFQNRYPFNQNIYLYPAFLKDNRQEACKAKSTCFASFDDMAKFRHMLYEKEKDKTIIYPSNVITECAIRNPHSWAFGPDGAVYKCWEIMGDPQSIVGILNDKGEIEITHRDRLNRYLYGADPLSDVECQYCSCLPICFGGCPHKRLVRQFEKNANDTDFCSQYKEYVKQSIGQILNQKQS